MRKGVKNRVFCVLQVSGANGDLDIFYFLKTKVNLVALESSSRALNGRLISI
jgi:hypothetical protein